MSDPVTRDEFNRGVDSLRRELTAGVATVGAQAESVAKVALATAASAEAAAAAVEKTVVAKIGTLKAWGVAALLGGQAFAGLMAAIVTKNVSTPLHVTAGVARAVAGFHW